MKIIDVKKTDKTPEVVLDTEKQVFHIKGKCLPENIRSFSEGVLKDFEKYLQSLPAGDAIHPAFRIHFRLGYFNSAAAKFIADVLTISGQYIQKGCNIRNYWYFEEDDHDMLEAGEEIAQMVNVPMEFIAVVRE